MSRRQRRYCFFQVNSLLINPCLPLPSVLTNKRQKTVSMPNNSLKQQNWGIIFKIQPFLVKSPLGCDKPLISILSVGIPLKLRADGRNIVGQHCWMLHVASVCTPRCMLLRVVGSCYAKIETG